MQKINPFTDEITMFDFFSTIREIQPAADSRSARRSGR
jgi:hypothetical protein